VVAFSDQTETEELEDKAEEYLQWTIEVFKTFANSTGGD